MRKELKKLNGKRLRFYGTFERTGWKNSFGYSKQTLLLKDVRLLETDQPITDHLWFNLTKGFESCHLNQGDIVAFDARADRYEKGYKGWNIERQLERPIEEDYRLTFPTKIEVISRKEPNSKETNAS